MKAFLVSSLLVLGSTSAFAETLKISCSVKDGSKVVQTFNKTLTGESQTCGRYSATDWASQNFVIKADRMEDLSIQLGTQTDPCMDEGPGIIVKVGGERLNLEEMNNLNDSYRTDTIFQTDNFAELKGATLFSWKGFARDNQVLSLSCKVLK